jgi:hypothetical protein
MWLYSEYLRYLRNSIIFKKNYIEESYVKTIWLKLNSECCKQEDALSFILLIISIYDVPLRRPKIM